MPALLLRGARLIDRLNERIGHGVRWLVLAAVLISASNAMVRYLFNVSSNAWLELQWYLFAAVFLLASPYTLLCNEHVRIDVVTGSLSRRTQAIIDILGGIFFLLPMALMVLVLSWSGFVESFVRQEVSADAGGLIRWPARLLIPVGFALLTLQGLSEIVKRIAFLRGLAADPAAHPPPADDRTPNRPNSGAGTQ
jgi:TRAP-type mannitol/chloroaromatic compound transport system permease small subunit